MDTTEKVPSTRERQAQQRREKIIQASMQLFWEKCVEDTSMEAVKKAQVLQKKTKASYPFLIPDSGMMNGRLNGISAFPETFFVDKNGNIVGETYSGSHSLDEWKEIVEKELENVTEGK